MEPLEPKAMTDWVPAHLAAEFGRYPFKQPDDRIHRLMLDSMVFDAPLEEDAMLDALRRAVEAEKIEFLVTHIQVDELIEVAHKDREKAKRLIHTLLRIGTREVPTFGIVLDHSRLDMSEFTDDETSARIDGFIGGNPNHTEDALIASTAERFGVPLITDESRRERYTKYFPDLQLGTIDDLRDIAKIVLGLKQANLR